MASQLRYKTYRDNTAIPAKLKNLEDELLALGFELDCLLVLRRFLFPTKLWIYRNREEHVEAYISETTAHLWFSSSFEKGFDVTTRFRHGEVFDNKKLVVHIVKTSISAAFDYHLQHRQKYTSQYGSIILFENAEQQLEWEQQQNVNKEINREMGVKLSKTFGLMFLKLLVWVVLALLIGFPFKIYLNTMMPEQADNLIEAWVYWFGGISVFINITWGIWSFYVPKTVEDRKGKKQVKDHKDKKQELYPF